VAGVFASCPVHPAKEFQGNQQDREHFAQRVAKCLYSDRGYDQAEALFRKVLEKKGKRLRSDDEEMLHSMELMAFTYQKQGRWMEGGLEAEQLRVQVIETRKTVLGLEHPSPWPTPTVWH
jgi:hypothetical protein